MKLPRCSRHNFKIIKTEVRNYCTFYPVVKAYFRPQKITVFWTQLESAIGRSLAFRLLKSIDLRPSVEADEHPSLHVVDPATGSAIEEKMSFCISWLDINHRLQICSNCLTKSLGASFSCQRLFRLPRFDLCFSVEQPDVWEEILNSFIYLCIYIFIIKLFIHIIFYIFVYLFIYYICYFIFFIDLLIFICLLFIF